MDNTYYIFSSSRFSFAEPRFSRICAVDPVVRLIGCDKGIGRDGYLDFGLSQLESLWLVKILRTLGIESYPVAERYKLSSISSTEAKQVAQNFVSEQRIYRPEYKFNDAEEVSLPWRLSKIAFGYFSKSEKMQFDGVSPGGLSICIDRASGLILKERELINAELPVMLTE